MSLIFINNDVTASAGTNNASTGMSYTVSGDIDVIINLPANPEVVDSFAINGISASGSCTIRQFDDVLTSYRDIFTISEYSYSFTIIYTGSYWNVVSANGKVSRL